MLQEIVEYFAYVSTFCTLAFFTPLWAPWLIYSGIESSARQGGRTETVRSFTISELSCVFVYVGLANALFNAVRIEYQQFRIWSIAMPLLCNALAVAMWLLSLQFANSKRIASGGLRILTILLFYPCSAIVMTHAIASLLGAFSQLNAQDAIYVHPSLHLGALFLVTVLFALALRSLFARLIASMEC